LECWLNEEGFALTVEKVVEISHFENKDEDGAIILKRMLWRWVIIMVNWIDLAGASFSLAA
jgi:hypothetical protein